MEVTKIVEWDMGHRVPNHKNKCRHPHGHRYRLELTIKGNIKSLAGSSDEGMVIDFGDIKDIMKRCIHDPLDHSFMIWNQDPLMAPFAKNFPEEQAFILVDSIPTAENIIMWCYEALRHEIPKEVTISRLRLYETPNSWADFTPDQ